MTTNSSRYLGPLYAPTAIPEPFRARSVEGFDNLLNHCGSYAQAAFTLLDDIALNTLPHKRTEAVYAAYNQLNKLFPEYAKLTRKDQIAINDFFVAQYETLASRMPRLPDVAPEPPCRYEPLRAVARKHASLESRV